MTRLAIVCTHPIQYFAPVFKRLAADDRLQLRVFYGWKGAARGTLDHGFGQQIKWDIPLLEGYDFQFIENVSRDPGSHHFRGIDLPTLCNSIEDWQADAIMVYGWCYKSHLAAMRHFKDRIPVFFRGDSTLMPARNLFDQFRAAARRIILRQIYRHIDVAFAVGTHNTKYFLHAGLNRDQIVFAPHAVDNERFASNEHQSQATTWRRSLEIPDNAVAFLLPAKLEPIKRPEWLLDAFVHLQDDSSHLVFCGSGALEDSLKARQVPRTHFLGFQNQSRMPIAYRLADLVVLPSQTETWGLALNEAMACSRAVLASDTVGAAIDLIPSGKNGWVVPCDDKGALAAAMLEAVKMGRAGLRQLGMISKDEIDKWTIEKQAATIISTVESRCR